MKQYIYILKDPDTNIVKYVGKTKSILSRYKAHLEEILIPKRRKWNSSRSDWYQTLLERDKLPVMKVIEITDNSMVDEREKHWIEHYTSNELVNSTYNTESNPYNWTHENEKTVYSYDEFTGKIEKYTNVNEASRIVKTNPHNIYTAINIHGRTKDLHWSYNPDSFKKYEIKPWCSRRLVAVTRNGMRKIYKNLRQFAKCNGIPLSKHNTMTRIRKGEINQAWGYIFEMDAHLKSGELLETCNGNQQPSSLNNIKVDEKVQRLTDEEFTNKSDTSAGQSKTDDIVRSTKN